MASILLVRATYFLFVPVSNVRILASVVMARWSAESVVQLLMRTLVSLRFRPDELVARGLAATCFNYNCFKRGHWGALANRQLVGWGRGKGMQLSRGRLYTKQPNGSLLKWIGRLGFRAERFLSRKLAEMCRTDGQQAGTLRISIDCRSQWPSTSAFLAYRRRVKRSESALHANRFFCRPSASAGKILGIRYSVLTKTWSFPMNLHCAWTLRSELKRAHQSSGWVIF